MNAPILQKNEKLITFDDGDETVRVRLTEWSDGTFHALVPKDFEFGVSPVGVGLSSIGAIADLFEKMPRAASEREERDDRIAFNRDHARDLRKHGETV